MVVDNDSQNPLERVVQHKQTSQVEQSNVNSPTSQLSVGTFQKANAVVGDSPGYQRRHGVNPSIELKIKDVSVPSDNQKNQTKGETSDAQFKRSIDSCVCDDG